MKTSRKNEVEAHAITKTSKRSFQHFSIEMYASSKWNEFEVCASSIVFAKTKEKKNGNFSVKLYIWHTALQLDHFNRIY